ncbi:MAG: response regulator [Pirellulales bacterium]|nr:response regulator [Pirellulales bacterium]
MRHAEPPVVLVVDDEEQVLNEVAAVLGAAGYVCQCCVTAEAAIRQAAVQTPDLIISDINLDGRSGLEMCETIKRDAALADVPVMFLSGAQIPDIIRRSHAVGGTYYLRKPYDPEVLVELVDKALWMPHLVQGRRQAKAGSREPVAAVLRAVAADRPGVVD